METVSPQIFETCPACGAYLDVAQEEPFALVHCSDCGTAMRVRKDFAHFSLQDILGEGGQGRVYKGLDKKLNRLVAIKVMRREFSEDPEFVKRFESEARITASLNHPNVVKVFSFGSDRGLLYIAMELVDKSSLEHLINHHARVPEVQALEVGIQIARGLKAGLEKGLLHRDLKPGNILFSDAQTPKLVDFGLAILIEKQAEETGEVWATPFYVPPEKLDGRPEDFRSDMYSLAATLFHALTGRPPFIAETNSMSELKRIKSKAIHVSTFAPDLSTPTAYCIDKALSALPDNRYQSYDEFIDHLEFARNEVVDAAASGKKPEKKNRVITGGNASNLITVATIALIVGGGLVYFLTQEREKPQPAQVVVKSGEEIRNELVQKAEKHSDDYMKARDLLLEQNYEEASRAFDHLLNQEGLREPYRSGSAVHLGLSELLAGKEQNARNVFAKLHERMLQGPGELEAEHATFFQSLAEIARKDSPVKLADSAKFKRDNHEAFALIIFGLKDWELGEYEEALGLLREFQKANPTGEHAWVADYRRFVPPYLEAYTVYRKAVDELSAADSAPDRAAAALQEIQTVKDQLRVAPVLLNKLIDLEKEVRPKVTAAITAMNEASAKKQVEQEAAEDRALTGAKQRVKQFCDLYRFAEALTVIRAVDVKNERLRYDRDLVVQRIEWLAKFKGQLVKDVNAFGYAPALVRRNGQPMAGGAGKANDLQVEVRLAHGSVPMAWSELSPDCLLAMARVFFTKATANDLAERQWNAGVFALVSGKVSDGSTLTEEAARAKEEYRIHRALFFGKAENIEAPAPAPADAAPPSEPEMTTEPAAELDSNASPFGTRPNETRGTRPLRTP